MVKRTLLAQKLTSYSVLATAVLAAGKSADAQILYTKVNDTICPNSSYNLDLNGDGITDFVIKVNSFSAGCTASEKLRSAIISHQGIDESIAGVKMSKKMGIVEASQAIFNSQQTIGGSDIFFSKYPGVLIYRADNDFYFRYMYYGLWDTTVIDKFAGLRLKIDDKFYYGWARLSILNHPGKGLLNGYCVVLTDYAIMESPNIPIKAGEEDNSISAEIESNGSLVVFPNPADREMPLNITFNLNYANESVTIRVYDIMGRQVNETTTFNGILGLNIFQIPITNLPAGIYQVKISTDEFVATKEIVISR